MKLSVIIPVYNGSEYAESLINMLKKNQHSDVEFIVVDDGSKDGTAKLIEKLSADMENFSLVKKENGGVSTARNKGIECASGEYIWFVDADDVIKEGSLKRICEIICDDRDLYVFDAESETAGKIHLLEGFEKTDEFEKSEQTAEFMLNNLMTTTTSNAVWNKVFKKSIIHSFEVKFPVGVINGEDTSFLLDYCDKISNMKYIKEAFYLYVIRSGSAARNIRPETAQGFIPVYKKKIFYCGKYGMNKLEDTLRKGLVRKYFRVFFHIKRNKNITDSRVLKDCISTIVNDSFIRNEFEAVGNVFSGYLKLYYKMHMDKDVKGIYRLVSLAAMGFKVKDGLRKILK